MIGNPPWVSYRYMGSGFQDRFRRECRAAGLWVGGNVATQQDLSGYFYIRAAQLYMRRTGRIVLVMPYAALSRRAYAAFRQGEVADLRRVETRLRFTRAWVFGADVAPLFPVPSCVLHAEVHGGAQPAALPERITAFAGTLPRRNATGEEARASLTAGDGPWPAEAGGEGGTPYRGAFRNGATLVPRRLVLVRRTSSAGILPPNPELPLVRGRTGRLDKDPWSRVDPPEGVVEVRFLRRVLLGESIAPFRVLNPFLGVIPWNGETGGLMDSRLAGREGFPGLSQWLAGTEQLWDRHKKNDRSHGDWVNYHGKLASQFPIAPIRVAYPKSGTNLMAAVVEDDRAIIDHSLYWAAFGSREEAQYLCAVLNSEALRSRIEEYQSRGQWGSRHFDLYVFNAPIPVFDGSNPLHRDLADTAGEAEAVARTVPAAEDEHFVRVRGRIRDTLADDGIAGTLEGLVRRLLEGS